MKHQLLACVLVMFGLSSVPAEDSAPNTSAAVAHKVLTESGVKGGLIVHLDCGDGTLTGALRVNDRYLVHGLERDPQKVAVARRKPFLLRLDPKVHAALERWAADELRSVNGQIEFLLRSALSEAGRLGGSSGPAKRETKKEDAT